MSPGTLLFAKRHRINISILVVCRDCGEQIDWSPAGSKLRQPIEAIVI
jgi:hypothetical protein